MKELTSKKTGKVMYLPDEVWDQLDPVYKRRYKVREIKPLMTKPPQIIAPEVKKVTKSK